MKKAVITSIAIFLFAFLFPFNFAFASNDFKVEANVESGKWTNQDIVFNFKGGFSTCFYSFDEQKWMLIENKSLTLCDEMEGTIYFLAKNNLNQDIAKTSFEVKIDKTPPSNFMYFLSEQDYTDQDIEMTVTADDAVKYNFQNRGFFTSNKITIFNNMTFDVGDIVVVDRAGNTFANPYEIKIDFIDKKMPVFFLSKNDSFLSNYVIISLDIYPIESGLESVKFQLNDGELIDITNNYTKGIKVENNGVYTFIVTSNVGKSTTKSMRVSNLNSGLDVWTRNLILIVEGIIIMTFFVWATLLKLNRKNIKNKHNI